MDKQHNHACKYPPGQLQGPHRCCQGKGSVPSWLSCSVLQLLLRLLWGRSLRCDRKLHADWRLGCSCLTRCWSRAMMLTVVGLLLLLGMQDSGMHCQHHLLDSCQLLLQHPHSLSLLRHLLTAHASPRLSMRMLAVSAHGCCCALKMPG